MTANKQQTVLFCLTAISWNSNSISACRRYIEPWHLKHKFFSNFIKILYKYREQSLKKKKKAFSFSQSVTGEDDHMKQHNATKWLLGKTIKTIKLTVGAPV